MSNDDDLYPKGEAMSKVVLGMNVTLDGYVARTNGALDWMFPNIDAERTQSIVEELSEIDTFLMGRVTYEGMAAHWPTADDEIAPLMNRATKVVFSRTLSRLDWENCRLATRDPGAEIAELKQQGKTIGVAGGATFAQSLSEQRLIDEYNLTIHPVALGTGLPLFTAPINLKLLNTRVYDTGAVLHNYQPA
jgi:dihydrofolate reductase